MMVFIPGQSIPVDQEDQGATQESPQVLSQQIVRYPAPADPAHHGQGHSDGGVEMATGHTTADQDTEEDANTPAKVDTEEVTLGVERQHRLSNGAIPNDD